MIWIALYAGGMLATAGFIGGIRDEMEGIGDMFTVAFWPLWLVFHLLAFVFGIFYNIGDRVRKLKEK